MGELQKCDYKLCNKCVYRMKFGFTNTTTKVTQNVACNYMGMTGYSRAFENGKRRLPPGYCNKFEEGEALTPKEWSSDAMTFKKKLRKRRKLH